MTADTVFPIASISKTVTALALVRLAQQGKVDLEAPVRRYLPDFAVQDPGATRDVAVWHLLTQTPGWEGQLSGEDRGIESLTHFAASLTALPQLAAPGAADILAYAKFHLGDGTGGDGQPVLSRAALEAMRKPRVKKIGTDDEMGLGGTCARWVA